MLLESRSLRGVVVSMPAYKLEVSGSNPGEGKSFTICIYLAVAAASLYLAVVT